jgi:glycine dehydrogenase subunit 1
MAHQNLSKAHFALAELTKIPGVKRKFAAPYFNEFTIELPRSARIVNHELLKGRIVGPLPLGPYYPELTKHALVCVTETTSRGEIERLASAIRSALDQPLP